jgi:signal transduction histidine kinase
MAVAHDAPAAPERKRWTADNPVVRGVGRVPLPLGGKLLVGFAVVAALLAIVAVLGLIALSQSNTRGRRLESLQTTAEYAQLLATDGNELKTLVVQRGQQGHGFSIGVGSRADQAIDDDVLVSWAQFNRDVQGTLDAARAGFASGNPLQNAGPDFARKLTTTLNAFYAAWQEVENIDFNPSGTHALPQQYRRGLKLAGQAYSQAEALTLDASRQAKELVAANGGSFASSRNLLIGVGSASLALALALGLLLSWSVVVPLRRTQARLSEIAAGDFAGHVEVPNRDEIGALASDVNRMNDELRRLYGELETASRHKSDFLATMSHELRTPLNAIIGFSEVLHEQMFGELNERQLAYVDDVLEAGRHLLSLINDVLDLAKIEAGRMELQLSQVALQDILRSAVSLHAERASRGGIELTLATQPAQIDITADERRVRQIVFNLLSNAVKFTPPDGRVEVSARLDDGHVEIAVADTGPGIPADALETIFEEFEQTGDGKQAEGTGLGLPLSRKLVELHHGRLWVESEPGRGSTFRFTLPTGGPS